MKHDLIPLQNPQLPALFKPNGLESLLVAIEQEARNHIPDVTTRKGREAIASIAAKVARSKTYLDGLGKDYVTELKQLPAQVDGERKRMRDRLDALRDEVRKPLTDWENFEAEREATTARMLAELSAPVVMGEQSTKIALRLESARNLEVPSILHPHQAEQVMKAKAEALQRLESAHAAAMAAEQREEELARLRAEAAERQRLEYENRIRQEAAERAKREAEAERQRVELARQEAERRQREAERLAAESEARRQREAAEAAERQRMAVEAAERRERERIEAERIRQEAAERAKREAELQAEKKRATDLAHQVAINQAVTLALMQVAKLSSAQAVDVLAAIAAGQIPAVSINY